MAKSFVTKFRGENFFTPETKIKDEPVSPDEEHFGDQHHLDYFDGSEVVGMRKSLSLNDIAALREDFMGLDLQSNREDQRYRPAPCASQELSKTKFVSMAEAIYHYQRDTPGRFHSTKPQKYQNMRHNGVSGLTVPQSPMLRCKTRARPVHIESQKDKEERELEEMKKFKLRANPIPKSVLQGTRNLPDVSKKPPTIPEPFKLTEIHKKAPCPSPEQILQFKARPAPRHILEKPHIPPKSSVSITVPDSPKLHFKKAKSEDRHDIVMQSNHGTKLKAKSAEKSQLLRQGPIKPVPFSFVKRDEEIKKRKEEWIKQQIHEEKKQASQFKAQPLPVAVKKRMCHVTTKSSSSNASENKENHVKFEARPANVLYKEPFKPVRHEIHIIKSKPFQLTTEKRAAEREMFEQHLKDKEKEMEHIKEQKEKERLEAEEREKVKLRAKLVHHAKPVPLKVINKPFVPEKLKIPLTVPETPTFVRKLNKN